MAFHIGPGSHDGGVAVDAHHHIRDIDGVVAELGALAGGDGLLLGRDLAERGDGNVVFGEGARGEVGVAAQAGLASLPLHVEDLADRGLLVGLKRRRARVNGDMLRGGRESRRCEQGTRD